MHESHIFSVVQTVVLCFGTIVTTILLLFSFQGKLILISIQSIQYTANNVACGLLVVMRQAHRYAISDPVLSRLCYKSLRFSRWQWLLRKHEQAYKKSSSGYNSNPMNEYIVCIEKYAIFNEQNAGLTKSIRCEQDSNLRGNIPLDFESNALTTRPSQLTTYVT